MVKTGSMQCVPYSVVVNYGKYRTRPLPQKRESVSYNCHIMYCIVTKNTLTQQINGKPHGMRCQMVLHPSVYSIGIKCTE